MRSVLKKILRWLLGIASALFLLATALLGPVDYTPITGRDFYLRTMHRLDSFKPLPHPPSSRLKIGWATINITPRAKMPMAGYAPRDHFDFIHDSVYVRILAIDNGGVQCFIISADLLLFPPALKEKILAHQDNNRFLFFTATHAHSSIGGWDDSIIGNLVLGGYNEPWLDSLSRKIDTAMDLAASRLQPAAISYFETDASDYVENRIDAQHGQVDGALRGLKIIRSDGSKGLLVSYSAHPTNISHLSRALSGDYPSALVRRAEQDEYAFALFSAGAIGSHRVKAIPGAEFSLCDTLAARLYMKIKSVAGMPISDSLISTAVIPIDYGPSQLHVLQQFRVRDWVFRVLFRKLKGDLRYLKIGNIILLGTPCDFSGEISQRDGLERLAKKQGENLLITSFDGDYVGYITYDDHYGQSEQEEVMAMNWVGPHFGDYYSGIITKIIERSR